MPLANAFVVLIERTRAPSTPNWVRAGTALLMSASLLLAALAANPAAAQPGHGRGTHVRVSADLAEALDDSRTVKRKWAREGRHGRQVQAIVVSDGADPQMTELRAAVLRLGGSVQAVHVAVKALTVQLPARQVKRLAQRDDVLSIAPNRVLRRTASTLESIAGALNGSVRSGSTKSAYAGLDGSGIGIAVLDSGVMRGHRALLDGNGVTRVRRNVNMLGVDLADWTSSLGANPTYETANAVLTGIEAAVANDNNVLHDGYGHGTHVAAVAAGRAKFYAAGTPDTTGIAPGAHIVDVKVAAA